MHWYNWVLGIVSCLFAVGTVFTGMANAAHRNNMTQMVFAIIVFCLWVGVAYWNLHGF